MAGSCNRGAHYGIERQRQTGSLARHQTRAAGRKKILLLQGGGALGAYQGGVYEELAANKIEPDWVAGISIGAINAAIIAGNPPEARIEKLKSFWKFRLRKPARLADRAGRCSSHAVQ